MMFKNENHNRMPNNANDQHVKLMQIVQEAMERDMALRKKYEIDSKFRFVTDLLNKLTEHLQTNLKTAEAEAKDVRPTIAEDEQPVYVYLFNAQGITLRSWHNMLTPKVFYEYSVNRPIYADKALIESLLRTKSTKAQHAYLTIAIKKSDILSGETKKDAFDNPLIKVREGSLLINKLLSFTHNEQDYELNQSGELVKK